MRPNLGSELFKCRKWLLDVAGVDYVLCAGIAEEHGVLKAEVTAKGSFARCHHEVNWYGRGNILTISRPATNVSPRTLLCYQH